MDAKKDLWDLFVSYRGVEPDRSWVQYQLVPCLKGAGLKVCVDFRDFQPGAEALPEMERAREGSRRTLCVLSPDYFAGNRFTVFEALQARTGDLAGERSQLVPLILRATELPSWLRSLIPVDWTAASDRPAQWRRLLAVLGAKDLAAPFPGGPEEVRTERAPRRLVFENDRSLPGQEFAIELLTEPVVLRRGRDGKIRVTIDRNHVVDAIYTTAGKRELCHDVFSTRARLAEARCLDAEIHQFLLGKSKDDHLIVYLDNLPLRWASGGILSVIRWRGALWTPFFFRDIPPVGWNLALGSSEREDDLTDPWTFLLREFLEETLVVDAEPRVGAEIGFKPFVIGERLDTAAEVERAERYAARHIRARLHGDGLTVRRHREASLRADLDRRFFVVADFATTHTEVQIKEDEASRVHRNLLVAINLLELGIEVVKILVYSLEDQDCILDGETRGFDSRTDLLRQPVALISHRYLARVFGPSPGFMTGEEIQPSIELPRIPARAFHLYPWDVERRREIARSQLPRASSWEKERYEGWLREFGALFFDGHGRPRTEHERTLFTPASAKILSYYFASTRPHGRPVKTTP